MAEGNVTPRYPWFALLLFLATAVPWVGMGNAPAWWSWVPIGVALIGVRFLSLAGALAPVVAALCIYGATASLPCRGWQLGCALLGLAIIIAQSPARRRLGLLAAGVGISLACVWWVLRHSAWQGEADRLGSLWTGLAAAALAFLALRAILRGRPAHGTLIMIAAIAGLAAARQFFLPPDGDSVLPAWRSLALSLNQAPTLAEGRLLGQAEIGTLERLRAAGSRDAAYAWSAIALSQNADLAMLRAACPRQGWTGALNAAWDPWIAIGQRACAAATAWPETGAQDLAAASQGLLLRLRGDLLMEAGAVALAVEAYNAATTAGDYFAQRDAVAALLARNRPDEARELAGVEDPLQQVWLHADDASPSAWQAYNHALDFVTLAAPSRTGLITITGPGDLGLVYDAGLGRRVLSTLPSYAGTFAMTVAPPPGGQVPAQLRLMVKKRADVWLQLVNDRNEVVLYGCGPSTDPRVLPLPAMLCAGNWTEAQLAPQQALQGTLRSITLGGDFLLAYLAASPLENAP